MAYTFFEVQVEGQKVESRNSFIRILKKQPFLAESVRERFTLEHMSWNLIQKVRKL
jgi:hypothetical protein